MAIKEKDQLTGIETTGHEWDGLKELNNPLPKWWLYTFYVCVIWAVAYWVFYPAWPLGKTHTNGILNYSERVEVTKEIKEARQAQSKFIEAIKATPVDQIRAKPDLFAFAVAGGKALFGDNCATCHGAGGTGAKGFPALADDDWLWGGKVADIYQTVQHGIRATTDGDTRVGDMPAFGKDGTLTKEQINDVAEYVVSFSGKGDATAAGRGAAVFAEQCAACHGEKGEGNPDMGAPRLSDGIWLYGAGKATVVESVTNGRKGVMPAWSARLDDVAVKQLAVYVHGLGGGK